jgi:hypothetical protein
MKDSIDYIDIIDIKMAQVKRNLENKDHEHYNYFLGRLAILIDLREIAIQDCEEHHADVVKQMLKVRRVVNKM